MLASLAFPAIDPIAISIGPLAIRWYALAYIAGLLLGWKYCVWLSGQEPRPFEPLIMDDLLVWATFGVVLGGRLGYVLFYKPEFYLANPTEIVMVWRGGMSFHGGLLGVVAATWLFARNRGVGFLSVIDVVAAAAPIGLFFGRIANFINGELFGRASDVPWAMVFPHGGPIARHPSQLYEAALEGLLLFVVIALIARRPSVRVKRGALTGLFLVGYAIARILAELFREPDAHLGFLAGGVTMGQVLSLPMLLIGLGLVWLASRGSFDDVR